MLIIVSFSLFGCSTFWAFQTGKSYTNDENIPDIQKAQWIQNVYWECVESPDSIESKKAQWIEMYGEDITNRGISLYENSKENEQ